MSILSIFPLWVRSVSGCRRREAGIKRGPAATWSRHHCMPPSQALSPLQTTADISRSFYINIGIIFLLLL